MSVHPEIDPTATNSPEVMASCPGFAQNFRGWSEYTFFHFPVKRLFCVSASVYLSSSGPRLDGYMRRWLRVWTLEAHCLGPTPGSAP